MRRRSFREAIVLVLMLDIVIRTVTVLVSSPASPRRWAFGSAEHCCALELVDVLMSRQMAVENRASSHPAEQQILSPRRT